MKSRMLTTYLVGVLLLVSCSDRVYTYRKTCKVKSQEIVKTKPVKETKEERNTELVKNEEVKDIAKSEEVITADAGATMPVTYKPVYKQEEKAVKIEKGGDKIKLKPSAFKKLKKEILQKNDFSTSSIEFKLIIAGLIFLLVGIIVYAVSGAGGALLTAIGVVLIIVGLLLWLIDFL